MNLKNIILAGVSAIALDVTAAPAFAAPVIETISANQWYTAGFGTAGLSGASAGNVLGAIPVLTGGTGTHGPVLPTGFQSTANTVTTGALWYISAPNGGYLTITDEETSGDQFKMFVGSTTSNGTAMTPTVAAGALGGQVGLSGGLTSAPGDTVTSCAESISCGLTTSNYSSGTFALLAGDNYISGQLFATVQNAAPGDANFIVELNSEATGVPEPATLSVLAISLAGLGALRRRRKSR